MVRLPASPLPRVARTEMRVLHRPRTQLFSLFTSCVLRCRGCAGATRQPVATAAHARAPPRTKPQCDLKRACFNYMIASRPTPSGYSPPRASSASGRTCRSEWACRSRRRGSYMVKSREIGGFGGGKLEHPRRRLGAQWACLSSSCPLRASNQPELTGVPKGGARAELRRCPG